MTTLDIAFDALRSAVEKAHGVSEDMEADLLKYEERITELVRRNDELADINTDLANQLFELEIENQRLQRLVAGYEARDLLDVA